MPYKESTSLMICVIQSVSIAMNMVTWLVNAQKVLSILQEARAHHCRLFYSTTKKGCHGLHYHVELSSAPSSTIATLTHVPDLNYVTNPSPATTYMVKQLIATDFSTLGLEGKIESTLSLWYQSQGLKFET